MEKILVLILFLQLTTIQINGYPYLQLKIPNGEHVPHPCKPNFLWHGVGHVNAKGGSDRNPFGVAFGNANYNWKAVCQLDSDGDGRTNGEELGDPNCNWDEGEVPEITSGITHPGICDPWDSQTCRASNTWVDCDPENEFKCDAFNEAGMKNTTVKFPATRVPPTETNYYCMIFDLPQDDDYHLVATTPHIDNKYVMHHILLFGCDESQGELNVPLNQPEPCGMGNSRCYSIIGLWAVGFDGECFHNDVGMRIGTRGFKKAMMQFHWNNPEFRSDYVDASGMNLFYTPNRRTYDAGVLMIGQNYLQIPPRQEKVEVVGTCHEECTRRQMTGAIKVTRALNHMHYLGRQMKIEHFRNGAKIRDITNEEVYSYDSPVTYEFQNPIEILPGDELKTTCVFKSTNKLKTTFQGDGTSDEMCFGFLTFHPKESFSSSYCVSWMDVPLCKIYANDPVIDNCEMHKFANATHPYTIALTKGVTENCLPFGSCLPECLEEIKKIQNHPCVNSDIAKYMKSTVIRQQNTQAMTWYAMLDSCSAELALLNQEPCVCDDCKNRETNASNLVKFSFQLIAAVLFFVCIL